MVCAFANGFRWRRLPARLRPSRRTWRRPAATCVSSGTPQRRGAPRAPPVDPARHGIGAPCKTSLIVAESPVPAKRSEPPCRRPSDEASRCATPSTSSRPPTICSSAGGAPEVAASPGAPTGSRARSTRSPTRRASPTPARRRAHPAVNLFRLRSGALLADLPGWIRRRAAAVEAPLAGVPHALLATRQSLVGLVLVVDGAPRLAEADRC
jgi:hypothetical protein